jgi:hypothetical protein
MTPSSFYFATEKTTYFNPSRLAELFSLELKKVILLIIHALPHLTFLIGWVTVGVSKNLLPLSSRFKNSQQNTYSKALCLFKPGKPHTQKHFTSQKNWIFSIIFSITAVWENLKSRQIRARLSETWWKMETGQILKEDFCIVEKLLNLYLTWLQIGYSKFCLQLL